MALSRFWLNTFVRLKKSRVTRDFFHHPSPPRRDPAALPQRIYLYWDSGLDSAPELVRRCVASWRAQNPGWEVEMLDQQAADNHLPRADLPETLSTAHYSDLLRTRILQEHGGVWADATSLCTRPLDDWLPQIFCQCGLFLFSAPAEDRAISTWFMAGVPGHPLLVRWHEALMAHWGDAGARKTYFGTHYLFEALTRCDPECRHLWAETPALSANPPHLLQRCLTGKQEVTEANLNILRATPLHKLTYKKGIAVGDLEDLLSRIAPATADRGNRA